MYQQLKSFQLEANARGRSKVFVQLWWLVQSTLFSMSPQFMFGWRRCLLRAFGAKIGEGVLIRPSVKIVYPWKLSIGDYSWIGDHATLYTLGEIVIGDNVVISQHAYLCTGTHDYRSEKFEQLTQPIVIEREAWVAADVFVAPGITVGRGALIAARSSVFKDMPEGMICIGNPAKAVRPRRPSDG